MPDIARCRSCNAKIFWCKTVNGKTMPVDFEPSEDGTILIVGDKCEVVSRDGVLFSTPLHKSHFATCKHAASHRQS